MAAAAALALARILTSFSAFELSQEALVKLHLELLSNAAANKTVP